MPCRSWLASRSIVTWMSSTGMPLRLAYQTSVSALHAPSAASYRSCGDGPAPEPPSSSVPSAEMMWLSRWTMWRIGSDWSRLTVIGMAVLGGLFEASNLHQNSNQVAGNAEADDVITQHRRKAVAQRRTQVARVVQPRAAAQDAAVRIAALFPRLAGQRRAFVGVVHHVLHPLPHIAVHVVQAPGVGREFAGRCGALAVHALRAAVVGVIAVVVGELGADAVAETEGGLGAGRGPVDFTVRLPAGGAHELAPLADRHRIAAHRDRLFDADPMLRRLAL